jgi:hypothetical protein
VSNAMAERERYATSARTKRRLRWVMSMIEVNG